jgi:adenylate cyclase
MVQEKAMERRLVAILAADVVGYSRLMAADETGTLTRLKQLRADVIEPKIVEFNGHIVGAAGDSLLVEFPSAVNAVCCALATQKELADQNASLPEDRRMAFRMGVNLGDVIPDRGTIYGDGVNIAARMEALAEPGGLCISGKVYDEVRGKVDTVFEDAGEQQLKNISAPVRVYLTRSGAGIQLFQTLPTSGDPSIAVLPFANLSGDMEQQYFSDGITEDIITELSRFGQLQVVARNSSFRFRGADLDMIRIGRELGVGYLVEGSVRGIGPRVRITTQLIDARSGHHLWAEKFDRNQEEIFSIQDEVVRTIVASLMGRLQTAVVEGAKRKPPASLAAYECVLRADALPFGDADAEAEARRLLEKAIALDPGYARAYAYMANSYRLEWSRDMSGSDQLLDRALALAQRAVALDENNDACHQDLAWILMNRHAHELAEHHFLKALSLNPNRPSTLTSLGCLYAYLGRPDEALEYFKTARSLDPFFEPSYYWRMLGVVLFVARRPDEAISAFKKSPNLPFWVHGFLAACYAITDRMEDARRHAAEVLRLAPNFSIVRLATKDPFKSEVDRQYLIDGLRKAGLPE